MRSMCVFRRESMRFSYVATRPGPRAAAGAHRKCKRFSNRNMLRTTAPAPISSCRGGMGEAQGRSAAALRLQHPQERGVPNGVLNKFSIRICGYRARRTPGVPHSHLQSIGFSRRKSHILTQPCVFPAPPEVSRRCNPPHAAGRFSS